MKARILVADPPWLFNDSLRQSSVKRGAKDQYESVMTFDDIKSLPIEEVSMDDSMLALWVPGTHVAEGLEVMNEWGFSHKQVWVWVKTRKNPLGTLSKAIRKLARENKDTTFKEAVSEAFEEFDVNDIRSFYMGHYFRQTHEVALIGVRGKLSSYIKNKSQRSVFLGPIGKHSEKPEALQDSLEAMFDDDGSVPKLELFGRRKRKGWTVLGNECPGDGKDIRKSLKRFLSRRKDGTVDPLTYINPLVPLHNK